MADPASVSHWTQNDTWPPLRLQLRDDDGVLTTLPDADLILFRAKLQNGLTTIAGTAIPIDPPDGDGFNLSYTWAAADLADEGTYDVEVEVQWDNASTPDKIETWGSDTANIPTLVVRSELG